MQGKKADIDREQILHLASRFWKPKQIAAFYRVSERTIYNYVNAEELAAAREEGCGRLIELAWERAATDKTPAVLIHLLQVYRDEVPQPRRALADISDEELAREVKTRMAVKKLMKAEKMQLPEAKVVSNSIGAGDDAITSNEARQPGAGDPAVPRKPSEGGS